MSTRPPGFTVAMLQRIAEFFRRQPQVEQRVTLDVPFPTGYQAAQRSRSRSPGRPRRSRYDVLSAGGGISYAEHDAHVRSAMAAGVERPSWRVWHGMRDDRLPHENNRDKFALQRG